MITQRPALRLEEFQAILADTLDGEHRGVEVWKLMDRRAFYVRIDWPETRAYLEWSADYSIWLKLGGASELIPLGLDLIEQTKLESSARRYAACDV